MASTMNDKYGQINRRFDYRASQLRKLGFKYEHVTIEGSTIAIFIFRRLGMKPTVIQASAVMHATDEFWLCIYGDATIAIK